MLLWLPQTNSACVCQRLFSPFRLNLQRNCGSYRKYCLKTLLKHTYLWKHILFRHPQPFVLASFGEIQALIRTLLFSISLFVVWVEHCFIRAWNSPVPPVGLAGFKRGGVTSRCVLFKWVWSLEETAHELPHAANKRRNVEIAVLTLHIKCYLYITWREQDQWEDSVDSKTIRWICTYENCFVFIYKWLGKVKHILFADIFCYCMQL